MCLRRSPCLAALWRKKQHDKTLNHVSFLTATPSPKEALEHQEIFTFKEATKSNYTLNFIQAMEHEIKNHTSKKHWKYEPMNEVPYDQNLRSTWTFRIKRNRSTGDAIKFKARFCADGRRQEFGVNYNEAHVPVVKWNTIRTFLTLSMLNK